MVGSHPTHPIAMTIWVSFCVEPIVLSYNHQIHSERSTKLSQSQVSLTAPIWEALLHGNVFEQRNKYVACGPIPIDWGRVTTYLILSLPTLCYAQHHRLTGISNWSEVSPCHGWLNVYKYRILWHAMRCNKLIYIEPDMIVHNAYCAWACCFSLVTPPEAAPLLYGITSVNTASAKQIELQTAGLWCNIILYVRKDKMKLK